MILEWKTLKEAYDSPAGEAKELVNFIDNDSYLYEKMARPIMKNLFLKMKKGTFDLDKSIKLWLYLVDEGAKKYTKVHGDSLLKWYDAFPKGVRMQAAEILARNFKESVDLGELKPELFLDNADALVKTEGSYNENVNEDAGSASDRVAKIEKLMRETSLSHREILEDLADLMSEEEFSSLFSKLREKYGFIR